MKSNRKTLVPVVAMVGLAALLGGCNSNRVDECLQQYHAPLIQALCMATEDVPNDTLDNATVLSTSDTTVAGSVQRDVNRSDFYIFTPLQTGSYRIAVGEGNGAVESDAIYIMLYDQTRTTIASTPIATIAKQEVAAELTAGVAYYIEVNGYNADTFPYPYRLAIRQVTELLQ